MEKSALKPLNKTHAEFGNSSGKKDTGAQPLSHRAETSMGLKYIDNKNPIEILPPEVIIKDIEINQTYEVIVLVRNLTQHSRRIRIFQPKTSKFRCDYDMQGPVAAGLAMKLVVTFETNTLNDYNDMLTIVSDENFKAEVPLRALMPQANIMFDLFLNFGFVPINREKTETVWFTNDGKKEGVVELKAEKTEGLKIEKEKFSVPVGARVPIKISYTPKDAGILRTRIIVTVQGQALQREIDVSATSVDFFVFVIDENGNQSNNFDFGDIYYGQMKELEGFLVNNSPQRYQFKTKFLKGKQTAFDEAASLQTPYELGLEQTHRIMNCVPEAGIIDSYSQVPLRFKCKPKVSEKEQYWTKNYSLVRDYNKDREDTIFEYSCFFDLEGRSDEPLFVHLQCRGICPTVKLSHSLIDFGECAVNDRRDFILTVENHNEQLPVTVNFPKISQFTSDVKSVKLGGGEQAGVTLSFEPKNLGKFASTFDVIFFGNYPVPVKVTGTASTTVEKKSHLYGPEAISKDFEKNRHYIEEGQQQIRPRAYRKNDRLIFTSHDNSSMFHLEGTNVSEKLDLYYSIRNNKQLYNQYLKDTRTARTSQKRMSSVKERFEQMKKKAHGLSSPTKGDDDDAKAEPPIDMEFWFRMGQDTELGEMKLPLPSTVDQLWVTRPIGKYEPQSITKYELFKPDPNRQIKNKFHSKPKSNAEERDINIELTPDTLQKVLAGPKTIDFGKIYKKSKAYKYFTVRNELKTSIMVQLNVDGIDELRETDCEAQIIPTMQATTFQVGCCSAVEKPFRDYVTYIINQKHVFKFLVSAEIEPVQLTLDRSEIKFIFPENSTEMVTSEIVKITNKGNAPGRFSWVKSQTDLFTVESESNEVPPNGGEVLARITYKPSGKNFKGEEEILKMKVEDGLERQLKCIGIVSEAKCAFQGSSQYNFGEVPVSQMKTFTLSFLNVYKNLAVFQVRTDNLPHGVNVTPLKGKIGMDGKEQLTVTVQSNTEQTISFDLMVYVRGGQTQKMTIFGNIVIPKVSIKEEEFNFGEVLYDNTKELVMTVVNESNIRAQLTVDLRPKMGMLPGVECLEIVPISTGGDAESSIMQSIRGNDELDSLASDDNPEDRSPSEDGDSDDEETKKEPSRQKLIIVKPRQTLQFHLLFTPKDSIDYMFELPIILEGFGKLDALQKQVICSGRPREFLLEPRTITFKKQIIKGADRASPSFEDVKIWNAEKRSIKWRFDTAAADEEGVFSIKPSEGRLDGGQMAILRVGFSPSAPRIFERKIYAYIDDSDIPYTEITVKGEGAAARLLFDRREVILPMTPLETVAKASFKVINDGYDNLTIKPPKVSADLGSVDLEFRFPGGQNVSIAKTRLRVDVILKYKKPLSFSTRVDFFDDQGFSYPIIISGTVDNSLFTVFPFLQRNTDHYKILAEADKPIRLIEDDDDDSDRGSSPRGGGGGARSIAMSKTDSHVSGGKALGYQPIPEPLLTKSTEYIVRWLNFNVLVNAISKFPGDLIETHGTQIFDLMQYLTGKSLPFRANLSHVNSKTEKVKLLVKQYDDLIRLLKENGALLNTIRPEYLLKWQEYNSYVMSNPVPCVIPTKVSEKNFTYISVDAWITLFYQILKIYYLNRVTYKNFRHLPGIPQDKQTIPDYYLEGSNIFSPSEVILLRWMEIHCEVVRPNSPMRITNFDESLRDGIVFANVIQSYLGVGRVQAIKEMRPNPQNEEDYEWNANKIITALHEIKLQTYFTPRDLLAPSQREMILFCLYLYNNLPHYIPKATIEFPCVLGETVTKFVELSNPTNRTISYRVELDVEKRTDILDFSVDVDEIRIDPKATQKVPVTFHSRVSKEARARLTFTNKKEGNTQAAAIVFVLVSKITGRISVGKTQEVRTKLYQIVPKDVVIENPFKKPVNFAIELIVEDPLKPPVEEGANKKGAKDKQKDKKAPTEPQKKLILPQSFFIKQSKLPKIPPNGQQTLTVWFLPFLMENYVCHIVLTDDMVGEIQYTITGAVDPPDINNVELRNSQFSLDSVTPIEIPISFRNKQLEDAKSKWRQSVAPDLRDLYDKAIKEVQQPDMITFEIENPSQFLLCPPTFQVYNPLRKKTGDKPSGAGGDTKKKGKGLNESSFDSKLNESVMQQTSTALQSANLTENRLNIGLAFRQPVPEYRARIVLRSTDRTDIRIFEFGFAVVPRPIKATLEFWVPAGEQQVQPIPIINSSDKDWNIDIQWKRGENGDAFSGPRTDKFFVKRNDRGEYPLTFAPTWKLEAKALLIFRNPVTFDYFEYELIGHGEDPMSKGNVSMKCKVREKTTHIFRVTNPYEDEMATFDVTTDLPEEWVIGQKSFRCPPKKEVKYRLEVMPILGGIFTGSITFTDQKGRYQWWTITIEADSPKSEKTVDLISEVRKRVAFEVSLSNPLKQPVNYEVIISGDCLLGDGNLFLQPGETRQYQLIFCPLRVMNTKGSVAFVDERLGEIWYELNLIGKEAPSVRLETCLAELGKTGIQEVELENPSSRVAKVTCKITNPANFDVIDQDILISPFETYVAKIQYLPSELDVVEAGEILFESDEIGKWHFLTFGRGLPPTKFDLKTVSGALNKDISSTIVFKNPFKDSILVSISMDKQGSSAEAFNLLLKKTATTIPGFGMFTIPFSFLPRAIADYYAEIVIMLNERVSWRYPIKGITEAYSQSQDFHITTRCRSKAEPILEIKLPGLADLKKGDTFDLEITQLPKHLEKVLTMKKHPWLKIENVKNTLASEEDTLQFKTIFQPFKPFKSGLEFAINKSSGGRWK